MEFKKKTLETQIIEIFQKISPAITRLIQSTMNNDKIVLNLGKTKSKNKNEININPSILVNSVSDSLFGIPNNLYHLLFYLKKVK